MSKINNYLKQNLKKRHAIIIILPILSLIFPVITTHEYVLFVITWANIFAIFAASWDLLAGVAGQFSFGHALFFGVAGYVAAALNIYLGLPPWITIPASGAFGVLVGLIVGLPSLRLKGPYFTITSLTFPLILQNIIYMFPQITKGSDGLTGLTALSTDYVVKYYLSAVLMITSIFILLKIANSRIGLIFRSIRDNEDTAEATGINTVKYKLLAFAISGFFAGIAGSFQVHFVGSVGPSILNPFYSIQAILFAGIGGIGTIVGSVGGAYLMIISNEVLRDLVAIRVLISAVIMVLVFRFLPKGIIRTIAVYYRIPIGFWNGLKKLRRSK